MKSIIKTLLFTGKTKSTKPLSEFIRYSHVLRDILMEDENGRVVKNNSPFWSKENIQKRLELIYDFSMVRRKDVRDTAYFRILNRCANGDAYGIK